MKQLTITAGEHSMTRLNISTGVPSVSGQAWLNGFPLRVEALGTDTGKTDPSTLETIRRIRS
jgi:hypothetical protein